MGKTVTMKKNDKFADIFDSEETITQAQKDGYHICTEEELEAREALRKAATKQQPENTTTDDDKPNGKAGDSVKNKNPKGKGMPNGKAGDKPVALTPPIADEKRKEIEGKVIEAGLKTADEIVALTDEELIALFDTIGK